ncbi:TlpA family protein disulfide reductase [Streptomyces apocyni]|uniref:TlpA family protein disulfide reductase n=1 Tax=Streptomyces apocyni TaxID=2654677 RepID=UPI0012EAC882|nr:redoxin domain-containing protein [Streptomyces apocyni]
MTTPRSRATATCGALLAAAALLVLTACGTESEDSGSPKESAPAASAPSSPGQTPSAATGQDLPVPGTLSFKGTTIDGKPFDGATLAGKPTVLWFWAPWCPTCRAQAPETAKVAKDFAGKANIVGVAGLDKKDAMRDFVASTKTDGFPQLADEKGDVWKKFKITQQSVYVILDKEGKETFTGVLPAGKGLADKLDGLLG